MLIRGHVPHIFPGQEPPPKNWAKSIIWLIAAIAGAVVLFYVTLNFGITPTEFDELG